ncbi:MAG: tRNA 2-selenouridine(34) synthase MnmH [Bacteroidota bacterium]
MANVLDISDFLLQSVHTHIPILDVRAPKEYEKGHIPGAVNVPLFENEERHIVGIQYKEQGRDQAVIKGLELVGPKLATFVKKAKTLAISGNLLVHCWRGGMRSQSMAWLWETSGFHVDVLGGGYKAYREKVRSDLAQPLQLVILGGKTGSGKTALLHALKAAGEQVIDLEKLANHKGSAFGGIGQHSQPSVEQFENELHKSVQKCDPARRIWVEDESNAIGRVYIPQPFWQQMLRAPVLVVEVPEKERIDRLVEEYARYEDAELKAALIRIKKRLGGNDLNLALEALDQQNYSLTTEIALRYYDKAYVYALRKKKTQQLLTISISLQNLKRSSQQLIEYCQTHISLHDRFGYDQADAI